MNYQYIKTEQSDLIATIRLNHYAKRNALSDCLIEEIHDALNVFGKQDVRALVLRSDQKNPVWSAGHDVMELPRADRDPLPADDPVMVLLQSIRAFRAPVIAMVDGSVWGASTDLIMSCDIAMGDHDAFGSARGAAGVKKPSGVAVMRWGGLRQWVAKGQPLGGLRAIGLGGAPQA